MGIELNGRSVPGSGSIPFQTNHTPGNILSWPIAGAFVHQTQSYQDGTLQYVRGQPLLPPEYPGCQRETAQHDQDGLSEELL